MHRRAHRGPALVAGKVVRDHPERGQGDRLLALCFAVLGDRLEQGARRPRRDSPSPGEHLQLLLRQLLERRDVAARPRVENVGTGQRNQRGEWRVVDRELQRGQLRAVHQGRHRLPRGDLLVLALACEGVEQHLAGPGQRFGDAALAAPDRGLDGPGPFRRARALLAHRGHQPFRRQHLPPLPGSQLGCGDDERLDLGGVRAEAMRGIVGGLLDAAQQTVGGGRHGSNFQPAEPTRSPVKPFRL